MNRALPVTAIVLLILLSLISLYALLNEEGLFKTKSHKVERVNRERQVILPENADAILKLLLKRTKFGEEPIPAQERSEIIDFVLDENSPLEERLTILFWLFVTKFEIPSRDLQRILLLENRLTHPEEFDFIRARLCILYSNPRVDGRELETYLPLAKSFILRSLGLTESELRNLTPSQISKRLEGKPLINVLYAVGVLFLCERYLKHENDSLVVGKKKKSSTALRESFIDAGISRSLSMKLLSSIPSLSDKYYRLPPPWLKPFQSFSDLPKELAELTDTDFSWEKIDYYPLLITASYADEAIALAQEGDPKLLSLLLNLNLHFMSIEPPSVHTFLPAVEALDLLFDRAKNSKLSEKIRGWQGLYSNFESLRATMNNTDELVKAMPSLMGGEARLDSRILFERIYRLYGSKISQLVAELNLAIQDAHS